jgi:hypothetical protein
VLSIEPGREEEFEALRAYLAASAAVDLIIEATEPPAPPSRVRVVRPLPALLVAAYRARTPEAARRPARIRRLLRPLAS